MADASVAPAPNAADPTLRFTVTIDYQFRYTIPLGVFGHAKTEKGVIIGQLQPVGFSQNATHDGVLPRSNQNENTQRRPYTLDCRLTSRGVDALMDAREANPKKDVIVTLELVARFLLPKYRIGPSGLTMGPPMGNENTVNAEQTNWGPGIAEIKGEVLQVSVKIPASDWANEFAPAFGVGRFLVVELPLPSSPGQAPTPLGERVASAFDAVRTMEADLRSGNWTDCVQHSRAVMELLKLPEELKALLVSDGLSEPAADDVLKSVRGSFDFTSKFIKRVERDSGGVNPTLTAKKEDAFFVYSNSVTLVNLLAAKQKRATSA